MKKPLAIPVLAVAMMAAAQQQSTTPSITFGNFSGEVLVNKCRNITLQEKTGKSNEKDAGLCAGYLAGFVAGTSVGNVKGTLSLPYCIPSGVSSDALAKVVLNYADAYPEQMHIAAPFFIAGSFKQAYPCPAVRPR